MNIQNAIVATIILLAIIYIGRIALQKLKSFSTKSSACANDCGCGDSKSPSKTSFINVQKFKG